MPCGDVTRLARITLSSLDVGTTLPLRLYGEAITTDWPLLSSVQVDCRVPLAPKSNERSSKSYDTLGARPSMRISMPVPAAPVA